MGKEEKIMIVQILENYHDYGQQKYMIDSDTLGDNPIDKMVKQALKKKAFHQEVFIDVNKFRKDEPNNGFWQEPELSCKSVRGKELTPEKSVHLTIDFDC